MTANSVTAQMLVEAAAKRDVPAAVVMDVNALIVNLWHPDEPYARYPHASVVLDDEGMSWGPNWDYKDVQVTSGDDALDKVLATIEVQS